ncbi:uncharacterized protein PAN0_001d0335 [Moesziomyces antarcticus]|uniref:Uncharacterized protein n=1 Tax=Pseudozyma antarctica TaxID=84753 RepID=A0A5C3FE32_PSEA2|nr:uncharacterized protein PAN0_001d0335 [Moesziomyces antarcticus]GAK62138.1 hypothetical protein PAN0_001d0335 [Moesziomyces antarcticus]SPO42672.1 uncharacterized protein PSANT_00355 [Moesziomyces antarcticus]
MTARGKLRTLAVSTPRGVSHLNPVDVKRHADDRQGPARLAATLLQSHAKRSPAVRHLGPSPSCLPEPPFFLEERERSGFQLHAHARLACKSVPAALPLSGNLVKTQGPSTCASACISAPVPLREQLKPMPPK